MSDPPDFEGSIDTPAAGATVERGVVLVRGWHACRGRSVLAVSVAVDGVPAGVSLPGSSDRPDVATHFGNPAMAAAGWEIGVDLSDHRGPTASVQVVVWPAANVAARWLRPIPVHLVEPVEKVDVQPDRRQGMLDVPGPEDALRRAPLTLQGWAIDPAGPIDRIEIAVNGVPGGAARLGLPRPDVRAVWDVAHAGISGFEAQVDLGALPADVKQVTFTVTAYPFDTDPFRVAEQRHQLLSGPGVAAASDEDLEQIRGRSARALASFPRSRPGPLDLLVFAHDLDYGGAQLWLQELLLRGGAGRRFPCTLVSPMDGPLRADLEQRGIDVVVASGHGYPVHDVRAYEGAVASLAALARINGHTAVLVNTLLAFPGADVALRLHLPFVWAVHESYTPDQFWDAIYPPGHVDPRVIASAMRALGEADKVVFAAESTRQLYAGSIRPRASVYLPYGVDTKGIDRFVAATPIANARANLGIGPDDRTVLVLATVKPLKAQTMLAAAFARMCRDHPDARLVFVGALGDGYAEALRRYVSDAGIVDRCRIADVIDDPWPWFRAADIVMLPSDTESLPRSLLEAMAFGVPVCATSVFGVPDLIDDGRTGFLFAPRSVGAAEAALRRVLGVPVDDLAEVGAAGARLVREHHEVEGYVSAVTALLATLAAEPHPRA